MKQKKIYLIRHGQTDYNKNGMVQGSGIDAPLNEEGHRQAELFWQAYKDYPFDVVYTSALQRTHQSVQKFLDAGFPHVVFEGLNEINWGHKEGKPFTHEEHDHYLQVVKAWQQGELHVLIEGGESPMDVQRRQQVVLKYLLEEEEGETILICMHGRAMRILLCYMLNYPLQNMDYFEHDNLGLYELTWTGSMFVVDRFNDRRHLLQD
ncbi:histidine phosphatase family protein [Cesiribacter sp. SM1]|uniref:histidine phosphatase family protein n=1 Tax=Cesiribacter sp. SM1 TaxID=2861196 RepID=UPI001CD587D3|nr:histidine phosphatase family protein [Cesiribacter sp. SM1]